VSFSGADSYREPLEIDVEEFIGVKSYKAKGKRISNYAVGEIEELESSRTEEIPQETEDNDTEDMREGEHEVTTVNGIEIETYVPGDDAEVDASGSDIDKITGQMSLF
jgi:topoisomerase-4 subunit A